jgi:hypothetical protein
MPMEKLLQLFFPSNEDSPACQARSSVETNCLSTPVLSIRKCEGDFQINYFLEIRVF